ncbi:MAG TPA: type V toxin-antitoxin system endoribonuclease antitoxin GhoS [Candidatus Acidoferrales bacterium]|jgi:hypothetical protein
MGDRMANYMATVELRLAGSAEYEQLDLSMGQRGYVRKITGEDGVIYQLPAGMYFVTNSSAKLEVALRAAVEAAEETGKKAGVMVTEWREVSWSGLARDGEAKGG